MKIDETTLDRIAELARLDVSDPARRAGLLNDMQRVFDFVEKLNGVDTTGVEPLDLPHRGTGRAARRRGDRAHVQGRCAAQRAGQGQRLLQGPQGAGQGLVPFGH
ncbi:MAG: Asp-tRNA(Asn)/Glu-tRNA(Gln) amidotransferase subunit GatC [Flavobacteriales bacterium]